MMGDAKKIIAEWEKSEFGVSDQLAKENARQIEILLERAGFVFSRT